MVKVSKMSFGRFYNNLVQDPTIGYAKETITKNLNSAKDCLISGHKGGLVQIQKIILK